MGDLAKDAERLSPEDFKNNAEYYKFRLDVAKETREDSFTRKAAVWMTGLLVPVVTGALALYGTQLQRNETIRQNKFQEEETKRKHDEETTKRQVENARSALDMYVKNPVLFDRTKTPNAVFHVRMIAVISDNAELKSVFNEML